MAEQLHIPNGEMCCTCVHILTRDCSHLEFKKMPVIKKYPDENLIVVRCMDHEKVFVPPLTVADYFNRHSEEYGKFDRIGWRKNQHPDLWKRHRRSDICAFLLLDKISPSKLTIISAAEHDEIWIHEAKVSLLFESGVLTEDHIVYLLRCGVRYDADHDSFVMFV